MDAERWQRVQDLFNAALEREPAERKAFLDRECGGDSALRGEVEALLRSDAEAGGFLQEPLPSASGLFPLERDALEARGRVGKYEIVDRIGQGGFGVVYKGRDSVLQRWVAIKTCTSNDEKLRQRFFREAQIAAGLQHPNVVTVHDLGFQDGIPYLVQELLDGEDLSEKIRRGGPLPMAARLEVLLDVARGLEYAHSKGVLHRDVKPGNVRVLPDGSAKILDFGIAKLLHDDPGLTSQGVALGTVGYLAPEQFRGEPVDRRADVFAFGVLAYELIAGERPFAGKSFPEVTHKLLTEEPRPLREIAPGSSSGLSSLVAACLAKDPARRPAGFTDVIAALEPEVERLGSGAREITVSLSPPSSRAPSWKAVAAALVVAAAGLAAWLGTRGGEAPAAEPQADPPPVVSAASVPPPALTPLEPQAPAPTPAPPVEVKKEAREDPPPVRVEAVRETPPRRPVPEPSPTPAPAEPTPVVETQKVEPAPERTETVSPQPTPAPVEPAAPTMKPGDVITAPGPGVVPPQLLSRPEPDYPPLALRRKVEARVVVGVRVDEHGEVVQTTVKKSGGREFDKAAQAAARKARFRPATRDGIPGRMWTEMVFEFKLP